MKYTRHVGEDFEETTCMLGDDCRNKKGDEEQTEDDKKITSDMIGDGVFYNQVDKGEKFYCHKKCVDARVSEYRQLHDLNEFFTKEDQWTIKEENLAEDDEGGEGGDGSDSGD